MRSMGQISFSDGLKRLNPHDSLDVVGIEGHHLCDIEGKPTADRGSQF
jgi:hypothetical protein